MQIGVVAERLGLSVRTLHHWDEVGLVRPSERSSGGFRLYTEHDLDRLLTVRRMKPLGFSLDEMIELLASLDVLGSPGHGPAEMASAREVVVQCRHRAEQSCAELGQRLGWAEEFRDLLVALASPEASRFGRRDETTDRPRRLWRGRWRAAPYPPRSGGVPLSPAEPYWLG